MKRRTQNDDTADDAKEFNAHLQEAEATDLSELERAGSVFVLIVINTFRINNIYIIFYMAF